jgi:hypothetical protein
MSEPFIKRYKREFRAILATVVGAGAVAYALVFILVLSIPHLPLANKRTFYGLLRAQMAVDESDRLASTPNKMVLFLGSSVVERGVSERYMDSVFTKNRATLETMNAGTGGFCADANLPMFRAMLEIGLRPSRVVYGVGIQELNGASTVHAFFETKDTASVKLKPKTFWNIVRYGPTALAPLLDAPHLHQYLFAANNAFRDVPNLTLFDRLMFGENSPPLDSAYYFEPTYYSDLKQILKLCQENHIPVALYNAPLKPRFVDEQDIPYRHRIDSYRAVKALAREMSVPVWNFDRRGYFDREEFQDNYHLTPVGARKVSKMLADSILNWQAGHITQDGEETLE